MRTKWYLDVNHTKQRKPQHQKKNRSLNHSFSIQSNFLQSPSNIYEFKKRRRKRQTDRQAGSCATNSKCWVLIKGPLHVWAELLKPQSLRLSQSNGRYNWLHLVSAHGSTHTLTHSHNEHTSHQLLDQKMLLQQLKLFLLRRFFSFCII